MPHDVAKDLYRYLARDWGLVRDALTDAKCEQLKEAIPKLRKAYYRDRKITYSKPLTRRAYLAAFAPCYSYMLYHCLALAAKEALAVFRPWHRSEGVVCLFGGGPACEVFGLLDWLYEHGIEPRYLQVVILDREGFWRTFHSFLFSDLLSQHYRKTLIVPSYEAIDFPVPTGKSFDRTTVNYNFTQTGLLAEARIFSLVNCLSELPDHRGLECHLRYLTRLAWNPHLVVCADSAAPKRRPRITWLKPFFDNATGLQSIELVNGIRTFSSNWLQNGPTSQRIFATPTPRWENSVKRYVYVREVGKV